MSPKFRLLELSAMKRTCRRVAAQTVSLSRTTPTRTCSMKHPFSNTTCLRGAHSTSKGEPRRLRSPCNRPTMHSRPLTWTMTSITSRKRNRVVPASHHRHFSSRPCQNRQPISEIQAKRCFRNWQETVRTPLLTSPL